MSSPPTDVRVPTRTARASITINDKIPRWVRSGFHTRPVLQMPAARDEWHAQLRPFDRAIREHQPHAGAVQYLGLDLGSHLDLRLLASIASTDNGEAGLNYLDGRLHIYPGYGGMSVGRIGHGPSPNSHPVHHITIEENEKGTLRAHLSAPRENGKKPRIVEKTALKPGHEGGAPALSLLLRDPRQLDIAGHAWADIAPRKRVTAEDLTAELQAALLPDHPILEMPFGDVWRPDYHLQVHFILTKGKLRNERYSITRVTDPQAFDEAPPTDDDRRRRLTRIGLKHGSSLIIAVEPVRGKPTSDALMLFRRLHQRPKKVA